MQLKRNVRWVAVMTALSALVGCGGTQQTSQQDIQATIAVSVAATNAAQAPPAAATISPPTTAAPPASAAPVAPTSAPFAQAETVGPIATMQTSGTAAATGNTGTGSVTQEGAPAATPIAFTPATGTAAQTVNIELVFDSSGSMAEKIGGETKIQAARKAMEQVIGQLPASAPNFNVGFRVYGHKGDNTEAKKQISCQSTDLVVPVQGVNKDLLRQQTNAYQPVGWTPISLALQRAGEDLKAGENTKNVIIMVTDGEETCNGDPCAVAKALNESAAEVRIDVVGFGTAPDQDRNLRCISDNSGGTYSNAQDGTALTQALQQLIEATVKRSYLRVVAVGPDGKQLGEGAKWQEVIELVSITDGQGNAAALAKGELSGQGRRTPLVDTGEQRYEVPPNTYTFVVRQNLGYDISRGDLPKANNTITYTAQVVEGQETQALIGVGALLMNADGGEPEYACDLQLDVAVDGRWVPAYKAVEGFCSRTSNIVQGAGLAFDREYPLLAGRYRVVDTKRNTVLSDQITIEPGKTVTLKVKGLARIGG